MKTSEVIELGQMIAALIFQYGVPAALLMIESFKKEEITPEDIEGLKKLVRPPEEYFPDLKPAAASAERGEKE
jgi:hypothetical protein